MRKQFPQNHARPSNEMPSVRRRDLGPNYPSRVRRAGKRPKFEARRSVLGHASAGGAERVGNPCLSSDSGRRDHRGRKGPRRARSIQGYSGQGTLARPLPRPARPRFAHSVHRNSGYTAGLVSGRNKRKTHRRPASSYLELLQCPHERPRATVAGSRRHLIYWGKR